MYMTTVDFFKLYVVLLKTVNHKLLLVVMPQNESLVVLLVKCNSMITIS